MAILNHEDFERLLRDLEDVCSPQEAERRVRMAENELAKLLWEEEEEDADKDFDQLLRELEELCKLPNSAISPEEQALLGQPDSIDQEDLFAELEDSGPDPWEAEFYCVYCWKHDVIGEPVSNLICPQCLLRATMLGRWEAFWFNLDHGPLVL